MSVSSTRAHSQAAKLWPTKVDLDRRGNRVALVDFDATPTTTKVAIIPDRSSRAEVPGQQITDIVRMTVDKIPDGFGMWSVVEVQGRMWDVYSPPQFHNGPSRMTRHWSVELRARPRKGPGPGEVSSG